MWGSRKSASQAKPRKRYLGLRLLLIVVVVLLGLYVLPTPWAFHMGGRFSALGDWNGYGPARVGNGGRYLLYTELRGGIVNNHGKPGCSFPRCDTLSGSAQLCTQSGQHYTFGLTGAMHGWYSTDGSRTTIDLTGGTPKRLPPGWPVAFHGVWHGAVLPITGSPAGAASAEAGTAQGTLRSGTVTGFDQACRALAGRSRLPAQFALTRPRLR